MAAEELQRERKKSEVVNCEKQRRKSTKIGSYES
jgi:hypothetical protein